jgi:hypothetical protein
MKHSDPTDRSNPSFSPSSNTTLVPENETLVNAIRLQYLYAAGNFEQAQRRVHRSGLPLAFPLARRATETNPAVSDDEARRRRLTEILAVAQDELDGLDGDGEAAGSSGREGTQSQRPLQ